MKGSCSEAIKTEGVKRCPTLGKIKALLDDPSVSDGQKAALSALADFGEEYKLDCIKTDK